MNDAHPAVQRIARHIDAALLRPRRPAPGPVDRTALLDADLVRRGDDRIIGRLANDGVEVAAALRGERLARLFADRGSPDEVALRLRRQAQQPGWPGGCITASAAVGYCMVTSAVQTNITNPPAGAQAANAATKDDHGVSFHDLLSALNPLQYLPGVGTIYRAITGDVIPEALRRAGSMVVSGLLGGPIGLIGNIAATIAEKITGIDPEAVVAAQFISISPAAATHAETPAKAPASATTVRPAMTTRQLAAYGVREEAAGTLRLGDVEGADVLNAIQLARLKDAAAAYAATQTRWP